MLCCDTNDRDAHETDKTHFFSHCANDAPRKISVGVGAQLICDVHQKVF